VARRWAGRPRIRRVRPPIVASRHARAVIANVRTLSRKYPSLPWWIAGFAFSTLFAFFAVAQAALFLTYRGEPIQWSRLIVFPLIDWYTCAAFFPLFVIATRRWPIDRAHLVTRIPIHFAVIAISTVGKFAIFIPVIRAIDERYQRTFTSALAGSIVSEAMAFGAVAAVLHALEFYRRFREREKAALQLQAQLSDAQLRALRAQLNPHFLFNTLNAATTLLHRDADAADAMLTRLGELLRLTLRSDPDHETPLHEEMAVLERYLAIMRMRFADRVTVDCTVDPRVANALVPSFILQPIVENAFEHGVARTQRPGRIEIEARAAERGLVLVVRDNGPGLSSNGNGNGVGLTNTRRRLAELYGADGTLVMFNPSGGGTTVELRLPLRMAFMPSLVPA
jgi:two-component system LytT family sensor kinase